MGYLQHHLIQTDFKKQRSLPTLKEEYRLKWFDDIQLVDSVIVSWEAKSVLIENDLITAYHLSKLEIVLKFNGAMLANMLLPNKIQEPCQIQISDNKKYFQYKYILSIFA